MVNIKSNDEGLRELALFAGAGGGILGGVLLGWRTVCAVENNEYARNVLIARQNDGIIASFPIWDDVRTFDGKPWRGIVDVVSAGFPCQPFSYEGKRNWETSDKNLWPETRRVISEVTPQFVLLENVPGIRKYLPVVIRDLRRIGYTVKRPAIIAAGSSGALQIRKRIWIFAILHSEGWIREWNEISSSARSWVQTWSEFEGLVSNVLQSCISSRGNRGIHDAVAGRVDRLKALGNGQVPAVVRLAWKTLI
jgi:DNA (cytosine-5)-methyltransferase 1